MAYPTDDGKFILDTNASLDTVGAILSQVQNGVEHVIAYGSRTLSKPEQNYCVTDWELLAGGWRPSLHTSLALNICPVISMEMPT